MLVRFALAVAVGVVATPASATGDIQCSAVDGRSGSISMAIGTLPVLNVISATVTAYGKTWSTGPDAENPIVLGQAFSDRTTTLVDFTDSNMTSVFISLRTARVFTEKESGEAGVLRIGQAVYPVKCEG